MNDIFDVLAEPLRRDILVHLRNSAPSDMAVGDIVALIGSTQPTVSKHLKVLRDAGLVSVREDGQHRFYRVNPEPLAIVEGWVSVMNDTPAPPVDGPTRILPDTDLAGLGRSLGWIAADIASRLSNVVGNRRPPKSR
ncbi:MAG: metalloregulator ArsR/SmtB family transcription factor [Microbacteriaceae bacterium]|nr:metalloregulator ArsR/SmtB family transcription factor [Microbacteriaceae bacterium]